MRKITAMTNHLLCHSIKTERSYLYYLLNIEHGNYVAGSYTKRFIEYYVEKNIPEEYRHLYEIVER